VASRFSVGRATRLNQAPVAQLDRVLPSEGRGHRFESCRARQCFCHRFFRRAKGPPDLLLIRLNLSGAPASSGGRGRRPYRQSRGNTAAILPDRARSPQTKTAACGRRLYPRTLFCKIRLLRQRPCDAGCASCRRSCRSPAGTSPRSRAQERPRKAPSLQALLGGRSSHSKYRKCSKYRK
jgi:hypothetical protein